MTSSKLFLVSAKDYLETAYELSIYVSFKVLTYCHSITIELNKQIELNTLKHTNNPEIMEA